MFPAARTCQEHGKEELGTVPRPEPPRHGGLSRGTALAMERGPPASGAGVRYSAQLQVRAHLGPGSSQSSCQPFAGLPRPLLALVPSSLVGSKRLWILQEGGGSSSLLGKVRRTCLGDISELSRAEKKKPNSFGELEISTCLCRLWIPSVSVLPLLRGFWFRLKLRALGL